ncbi:MAG: phosphatidylserine decarboxylase [Xanthomonadales bacterium]|nr:phosphatidylserine decarboxylase [Xanthomonadales bacterium]NNL93994.1 phosphatidylserine decarboxylase [Xanthomonadales bacterium]
MKLFRLLEKPACVVQGLLPQRFLTAMVYRLMRIRAPWFKNFQIHMIAKLVGVDWSEAASQNPRDYEHFNAFFTRALREDARSFPQGNKILCSPCDGRVSELGPIEEDRVYQAKGKSYSLQALLAADPQASEWQGGHFATIYLSPRDYHRIHMPMAGRLRKMIYVPGKLFSVAPYTVRNVDELFAINERVICIFDTAVGPLAVILVGAMLVAGMETVWAGEITPRADRELEVTEYGDDGPCFELGQEMGRFNMGSTVVLLLPANAVSGAFRHAPGDSIQLGNALADLQI